MSNTEQLEREILEKTKELAMLRATNGGALPVSDYTFQTQDRDVRLFEMFGQHSRLLVIHNMGQNCNYCTLWADGINGILTHLESFISVVLVSKDTPDVQRAMANDRGWRFRMASHGGGDYMHEQCACGDEAN